MRTHIILTSLLLLIVGIFHGFRASMGWDLVINGYTIPIIISWIAALLTLALAIIGVIHLKK